MHNLEKGCYSEHFFIHNQTFLDLILGYLWMDPTIFLKEQILVYKFDPKAFIKQHHFATIDLIIYNCLSLSWVETQRICLTFSWDETEYYLKRSCVYKLKMISCNSTLCLFFISAKSQRILLSFKSTQLDTIVNNQVFNVWNALQQTYFL